MKNFSSSSIKYKLTNHKALIGIINSLQMKFSSLSNKHSQRHQIKVLPNTTQNFTGCKEHKLFCLEFDFWVIVQFDTLSSIRLINIIKCFYTGYLSNNFPDPDLYCFVWPSPEIIKKSHKSFLL